MRMNIYSIEASQEQMKMDESMNQGWIPSEDDVSYISADAFVDMARRVSFGLNYPLSLRVIYKKMIVFIW